MKGLCALVIICALGFVAVAQGVFTPQELEGLHSEHFHGKQPTRQLMQNLLRSDSWLRRDTVLSNLTEQHDINWDVKMHRFRAGHRSKWVPSSQASADPSSHFSHVFRATARIHGIKLVGLSRYVRVASNSITHHSLQDEGALSATVHDPLDRLSLDMFASMGPREAYAAVGAEEAYHNFKDSIELMASRRWLATRSGIEPTWIVRVPGLKVEDMQDFYVSASSGDVLRVKKSASGADSTATVFTERGKNTNVESATLTDLLSNDEDATLDGKWFSIYNCCPKTVLHAPSGKYVCSGTESDNLEATSIKTRYKTYTLTSTDISAWTDFFGDRGTDWSQYYQQSVYYFHGPSCSGAQKAMADATGSFERYSPVVKEDTATADDAFSEVQAYYSMTEYFKYLRDVLGDSSYCLSGTSMKCDDQGEPVLVDGVPEIKLNVFVNGKVVPDALTLMLRRLGHVNSPSSPFTWTEDELVRHVNAFYLESVYDEVAPFSSLAEVYFVRQHDTILFFQSDVNDIAYDESIVHHEFQHAVTRSYLPDLKDGALDRWGVHSFGGSLDEGWADYFTASHRNNPVVGEYVGGFRDLSELSTCSDLINEVHQDSLPFTSAMWQIRTLMNGDAALIKSLDKLFLEALSLAPDDVTFKGQAQQILSLMGETNSGFETYVTGAENIFNVHFGYSSDGGCARTVTSRKAQFVVSSPVISELSDIAPVMFQIKVSGSDTKTHSIEWEAFITRKGVFGGFVLPAAPFSGAASKFKAAISIDEPIRWQLDVGTRPNGYGGKVDASGNLLTNQLVSTVNDLVSVTQVSYNTDTGVTKMKLSFSGRMHHNSAAPNADRTYYVSILSTGSDRYSGAFRKVSPAAHLQSSLLSVLFMVAVCFAASRLS